MKVRTSCILVSVLFSLSVFAETPATETAPAKQESTMAPEAAKGSITGRWKSIDDETGKPKSIIEIFERDGKFFGKIEKLFREPTEDQNPKCDKCTGDKKDQLIIGMQILTDLKKDSDTKWSGGEILDPKNGKTYSCKTELVDEGAKLKVRGFIGFSLLGRTQVWIREK